MSNQRTLSITVLLLIFFAGNQIFAQGLTIDINKPGNAYSTDFSKSFTISLKDSTKASFDVAIKQGEKVIMLNPKGAVDSYDIKFSVSKDSLSISDKDGKVKNITNKAFRVVLGERSFLVNPSKVQRAGPDSNNVVIDLIGAKTYEATFASNFKLSFKTEDKALRDIVLSYPSSDGDTKLSFKQKDLTKFQVSFILNDKRFIVDDGQGKALKADGGKPFIIDAGSFKVTIDTNVFTVNKIVKQTNSDGGKPVPPPGKNACPPVTIIDNEMLSRINGPGGCQLCDIRSIKQEIESKNDRIYNTDYIVIYDPMLKKDAYAICKHVFEKIKSGGGKSGTANYYERYIKIGNKWFAPSVGSQIRFEVVNLPLNSNFKLSVDEQDVFNGGASQFASIINSLTNANIISTITGATKRDTTVNPDKSVINGGEDSACFLNNIDGIANDLLKYMTSFRISSCAIEQHNINLPVILSRINTSFNLSAVNADQLGTQLSTKIDTEVKNEDKVKAIKKAELIVNALKALENIKPLAYTTLRAKNRDYIEVRYTDANNVLSKPENIRMSGGMKIDFSAGFVLTGLRDYSYVLKNIKYNFTPPVTGQQAKDTTGNVIIKEDEGSNQVGVGLLAHFYPRASSHYNVGGTVGLMTSTNLNLRLMLGGSVMVSSLFGSNNRVSFSGGVVWGKVKRLSEKDMDFFNGPMIVNGIPQFYSQASAPQPIDRTDNSCFFAVTFNFGGN